jgi:hypothetical protein
MPEPASTTSEVIADRYLTSPAALRARPHGPVDALDTHSGRAAQVRIVFADGAWAEAELSEAVARWCAIGASGVCGVLDFGRHRDRWFLVLPPTLGMPVERWRSVRRPGLSDAARLVLGFGRLVESVAAAGFRVGIAQPGDFAVGPGPTTFLEHPLIGGPGAVTPIDRRSHGQALLAELFDCVAPDGPAPVEVGGWTARAAAAGFGSLGECLDELEKVSASLVATRSADHEPAGVGSVFDSQIDLRVPASRRAVWLGRGASLGGGRAAGADRPGVVRARRARSAGRSRHGPRIDAVGAHGACGLETPPGRQISAPREAASGGASATCGPPPAVAPDASYKRPIDTQADDVGTVLAADLRRRDVAPSTGWHRTAVAVDVRTAPRRVTRSACSVRGARPSAFGSRLRSERASTLTRRVRPV